MCQQRLEESLSFLEVELQVVVRGLVWVLQTELSGLLQKQEFFTDEPRLQSDLLRESEVLTSLYLYFLAPQIR